MHDRNHDNEVRARLHQLVETHSQAEVARKTGFGKHNVSRYLKSTKISAEFCSALIHGLGVNPAWLMVGEGAPYLSDVAAGTATTAGNLLELVQAMSQVAKMRLGALTGRTHQKVLRQLDDALRDYERLRSELNHQTRPFLLNLLKDYQAALAKHDLDRAMHLRRASHQVVRLCDDDDLARELDARDAYAEFQHGDTEQALRLQGKVFVRFLTSRQVDKRVLVEGGNYVRALTETGYLETALKVAGATLSMARGLESLSEFQALRAHQGWLQCELGELRSGLPLLIDSVPRLDNAEAPKHWGELILAQLMAGSISWRAALEIGASGVSRCSAVVRWTFLEEDAEAIRESHAQCVGDDPPRVLPGSTFVRGAAALVTILDGDRSAYRQWRNGPFAKQQARTPSGLAAFALHAQHASLALAAGHKDAKDAVRRAGSALRALPDGISPSMLLRAQHCRNVLRLGAKVSDLARLEQANVEEWKQAGYLGLYRLIAP